MSKNISELSGRKGLGKNLFEKMGQAGEKTGTVSHSDLKKMAEDFLIGEANTLGAASFYDFLREENEGKKVYVCNGSACMCAGTQDSLAEKLSAHFASDEIGQMTCLGRCHENNAFYFDGKNYSGKDIDLIGAIKNGHPADIDDYHVEAIGRSVLVERPEHIDDYAKLWKKALASDRNNLLNEMSKSGLRGRGGAGFPISIKLESCFNQEADKKFIVCNADEGDPGAYSDRYLLEQKPMSVLFGMAVAGLCADAHDGVLYVRYEYPESIDILKEAIDAFAKAGIGNEDFEFNFKVVRAQGAYICGEETALLSSLEGQRPEVRVRPPYPVQEGLFNRPTVVNNVETLACIPFVIDRGGAAFAEIGTEKSTGTKLISLDSFFNKPGIYEVEMGSPLADLVQIAGGFKESVKAMHIGGPLGGLVPVSAIDALTVDFESFANHNFLLGHASVVCIPEKYPLIDYLRHLFAFTAHESCGKCFPCRLGSVRGKELIDGAKNGEAIDRQLFDDLLVTLRDGSLCALGGGLPLPIFNALEHFSDELKTYFKN